MTSRLFASPDGRFAVKIEQFLLDHIKSICLQNPDLETGGILVGKYSTDLITAIVLHIDGPTKDSKSGSTWFFRGIKGLKKSLDTFWTKENLYYLGEWHYHPLSSPKPSEIDDLHMKSITKNDNMRCENPILLIIGGDPRNKEIFSVTVYRRDKSPIYIY